MSNKVPLLINGKEGYIVHKDIKPGNIIVAEDNSVKFIDFGFAKSSAALSTRDNVIGTPDYLDPQLLSSKKKCADFSTDLASLARSIAALLGDKSSYLANSLEELRERNSDNILTGLLEGISDYSLKR